MEKEYVLNPSKESLIFRYFAQLSFVTAQFIFVNFPDKKNFISI